MWILSEDSLELFRNVPFPCWVFLSLLCVGAQLSGVSGVHDFTIYRMQQFDLHGIRLGSRSAVINMEVRDIGATMLNRKCVILRWMDVTSNLFSDLISRGAGAILFLLPFDWKNEANITWIELEKELLGQEIAIPIYFAIETDYLTEVYTKLSSSVDKDSSATVALVSSIAGEGYTMIADATEAVPLENHETTTIVGKLLGKGYEPELPTVAMVTHYDSFGLSPGLSSSGDSGGSGVAAILELVRLFSVLYSDPIHQPRYNLLFILTGGGKLNYFGTKYFIEEMMEDSDYSAQLSEADYTLCLDALAGGGSEMFLHVSRPPKEGTNALKLVEYINKTAGLIPGMKVTLNHKKIRISDETLAWEHERFSLRRIPAATFSHFQYHNDPRRKSMFHTIYDVDSLHRNVQLLAESIGGHILGLSAADNNYSSFLFTGSMKVHKDYLKAWVERLSSTPRSAQLLHKEYPLIQSLEQTLTKYVHEVLTFAHKPDKTEPEYVLYTQSSDVVMHSYSVKPAIFDLVLALGIIAYIIGIYFFVINFPALPVILGQLSKRRLKID